MPLRVVRALATLGPSKNTRAFESAVALAHSGVHYYSGNVSEAARQMGLARSHIYNLITELALKRER